MKYEDYFSTHQKEDVINKGQQEQTASWYKNKPTYEDEYVGLSYKARKKREKIKKFLRISITLSCFLFFILTFLSLRTFGKDNFYTVKREQNLYRISRKFNVPLNILLSLNDIQEPATIKEGDRIKIPTAHDIHIIKKGETLYDIAKYYGIKNYILIKYNKLHGSRVLKTGDRIFIPRVLSDINIIAKKTMGLTPFSVHFEISTNTRDRIKNYLWDFGNNHTSHEKSPFYTYKEKGLYKASLTVLDENNHKITSNTLTIDVRKLANIQYNAPEYLEVGSKGEIFSLNTKAIDNMGDPVDFNYKCNIEGEPNLFQQIGKTDTFKIITTGYSKITVETQGYSHTGYYFVSPIPSIHSSKNDVNWYRTQFRTGINGNCGPACVSMAIMWAKGLNVLVRNIRKDIGFPSPDGGVGYYLLLRVLKKYKIKTNLFRVNEIDDLFDVIDRKSIIIILYNRGSISYTQGDMKQNLFGRYYTDAGGHYIIIKGYSKNKKYFVVYDPMPSDWWKNSFRYADGESMIGRNRYYLAKEVWSTLNKHILEVMSD